MSVQITDGIGFGQGIIIKSEIPGYGPDATPGAFAPDTSTELGPHASWGSTDNLQPVQMAALIESSGVLSSALDAKARIAIGKGPQPFLLKGIDAEGKEDLEWVNDPEIHDWLDDNDLFSTMLDMVYDENAYGWSCGTVIPNLGGNKINKLRRLDVYDCRLQRIDPDTGRINNLYLSDDWASIIGKGKPIPLLHDHDEYDDLADRLAKGSVKEFAFTNRRCRNGRTYYPNPCWWSAREWVKVVAKIPEYKRNMFDNQMTVKYLVTISPMYWRDKFLNWDSLGTAKQQEAIQTTYDQIENHLVGNSKSHKSIFTSGHLDPVTKVFIPYISIQVLDDKLKDGKLLPESSAGNSEILFALMVNPALMGAGQPGGPYANNAGGSNIREAYLVALMILEAERKMAGRMMNVVKRINGWTRLETDGARLVWRFPSGLLTTLDTGKSTKPENL